MRSTRGARNRPSCFLDRSLYKHHRQCAVQPFSAAARISCPAWTPGDEACWPSAQDTARTSNPRRPLRGFFFFTTLYRGLNGWPSGGTGRRTCLRCMTTRGSTPLSATTWDEVLRRDGSAPDCKSDPLRGTRFDSSPSHQHGRVAKLANALGSGPSSLEVQVLSRLPLSRWCNRQTQTPQKRKGPGSTPGRDTTWMRSLTVRHLSRKQAWVSSPLQVRFLPHPIWITLALVVKRTRLESDEAPQGAGGSTPQ